MQVSYVFLEITNKMLRKKMSDDVHSPTLAVCNIICTQVVCSKIRISAFLADQECLHQLL